MDRIAYKWRHLEDYCVSPDSLALSELRALADVWEDQRGALERVEALQKFNERLNREWAIETGLVERVYTLDRGVTQVLIERGIDAALIPHCTSGPAPERIAAIIRDHESVVEGLFAFVRGDRLLSTAYVKELHAELTRNQPSVTAIDSLGRTMELPLAHGDYKKLPNNPTRKDGMLHEYCPPEHVASEMDRLIELHLSHKDVDPEVEAAWLHHRFTQIHPFQDGNGRVARALATLVLIRAGWFPLVIHDTDEERARYVDALEAADHGDLAPLIRVFGAAQKKALVQALGISGQVLRLTRAEHVIKHTGEQLRARAQARRREWERAKEVAAGLLSVTKLRFDELTATLKDELGSYMPGADFRSDMESSGMPRDHYYRWQTIQIAKRLGYYANTREYRAWARLVFRTETQAEIVVLFHGTGHEFRGVLAASACFFRREPTEEGERTVSEPVPLSSEIFQINYKESEDSARSRFVDWLEDVVVRGLEAWRGAL